MYFTTTTFLQLFLFLLHLPPPPKKCCNRRQLLSHLKKFAKTNLRLKGQKPCQKLAWKKIGYHKSCFPGQYKQKTQTFVKLEHVEGHKIYIFLVKTLSLCFFYFQLTDKCVHLKLWMPASSCCKTSWVVLIKSSAPTKSEVDNNSWIVGWVWWTVAISFN